ncbi:MAG: HAD family hydrolase [Cytophagia bacterium]|nr:HAD family hydrolase [Cytophagia bacterium]
MLKPEAILWDFDGVILDSMAIRELGFRTVLSEYSNAQVDELIRFHEENGGLSRYVKFRYFFEHVLNRSISSQEIQKLSQRFSEIMRIRLSEKKYLIQETLAFIKNYYGIIPMHIVSGSDHIELNFLCDKLEITNLFNSIEGSPIVKNVLVGDLLERFGYQPTRCILIGDSVNDFEAASLNGVHFMGYNNITLDKRGYDYIHNFTELAW